MPRQRCASCGREDWQEKLLLCTTDGMWFCVKCCLHLAVGDPGPRCPRCYRPLDVPDATPSRADAQTTDQ